MFLFYTDESGNRDATHQDWLYVLVAVGIFEQRWHTLAKPIHRRKWELIAGIEGRTGLRLDLGDCEIKSAAMRNPHQRTKHPFLSRLTPGEMTGLVDLYHGQMDAARARLLVVLTDKRRLPAGTSAHEIHRRSWEALMELVEEHMRAHNPKHQALLVADDAGHEMNRMLAHHHAGIMDVGTRSSTWLKHICEMPMFARSEMSVGIQCADFCAYDFYRAFKTSDMAYPFFRRTLRLMPRLEGGEWASGLRVLGDGSVLHEIVRTLAQEKAPDSFDENPGLVDI